MNSKTIIVIGVVIIILVIASAALFWGSSMQKSSSSTTQTSSQSTTNATQPTQSGNQAQNASSVTIQNFAFSPASLTVKKGTTVTWTNKDSAPHTVTETDGKTGPSSSDLSQGQSYSFTYSSPGTYSYHCSVHPTMTGTVTVTE